MLALVRFDVDQDGTMSEPCPYLASPAHLVRISSVHRPCPPHLRRSDAEYRKYLEGGQRLLYDTVATCATLGVVGTPASIAFLAAHRLFSPINCLRPLLGTTHAAAALWRLAAPSRLRLLPTRTS